MASSDITVKQSENGVTKEAIEEKVLKNRLAQKKFREKKQQKYKELLERCNYLEQMNKELKENESLLRKKIEQLSGKNVGNIVFNKDLVSSIDDDNMSSSATSSKESENLADLIKSTDQKRTTAYDTAMNFSFPWGNKEDVPFASSNKETESSLFTDSSNTIISNKNLTSDHEHSHEYDFKNGFDENNFCNNLGDACPYTKSNTVKKEIVENNTLFNTAHEGLETNSSYDKSALNNIDSVFGLPNFSFSPTGFENIPSTDKSTNSIDFIQNNNLALNNFVDTPSSFNKFSTQVNEDAKLFEEVSPMNFNFNFLVNNSIDENPTKEDNINFKVEDEANGFLIGEEEENKVVGVANSDAEDEDIVVPGDGKLYTCSEVWDRITSNPKLSDLDLDNLCMELKTKARCSDKGVLIKEEDLEKALLMRQQKKEKELMELNK